MYPARAVLAATAFALTLALVSGCSREDEATSGNLPEPPTTASAVAADPVVVAAGDIVCGTGTSSTAPCRHAAVAALIPEIAPDGVLLLGDNQYERGTLADYQAYFAPTWGAHKAMTWPSAGNHEYTTPGAAGYFDYFNGVGADSGRAGDRKKGYYSFDIGAWHLVALNSNCDSVGGCGAGSPQEQWLRTDLAAHPATCTLAFWHHPRFSSGSHGDHPFMQALWQALYDHRADLVLAGHDHEYERFAPQNAAGALDNAAGIRSFVVGTGGKNLRAFATIRANSQVRGNSSFGVLKLTLHPESYDWRFVPAAGGTLADAGTAACRGAAPPPPPPGETTLIIPASADAHVLKRSPNSGFGSRATLEVDASPVARTYLKFPVAGVGARTVISAKLRLYAVNPSDVGGRLHRVTTTSWGESQIKWSNAPAYGPTVVGTIGPVVVNAWQEVNLTTQVSGDGVVSFALESPSTNGADYRSREAGSAWAPRLVIVVR